MKKARFSLRPLLSQGAVIGCLLFILSLTMTVQSQISAAETEFANAGKHLLSMIVIAAAVLAAGVWNHRSNAGLGSVICALGILTAIGSSYQMIFGGYGSYLISLLFSAGIAVFFYHFHRRKHQIPDKLFFALSVVPVLMMLALILFGTVENNALLGIKIVNGVFFRPAEFVKILIIYLGAHSYRNRLRQVVFSIVSLICCLMCIKCDDLGAGVIIFANFVVMSYLLLDSRVFSSLLVVGAAVALWAVLEFTGYGVHAKERLRNLFHAMEQMAGQQRSFLKAVIFGGFSGLGLERAELIKDIYAIRSDGCLAAIMAVYGVPMILLVNAAYALLACAPAYNRSLTPMGYLLLAQMTTYVFCHSFLSLAGAMDLAPFTGLATPIISHGINACAAFGILMGLTIGSLHPANHHLKE